MMDITGVARRIRNADFQYVLGRFRIVRAAYGNIRGGLEGRAAVPVGSGVSTLFPAVDIDKAVASIRDEAVYIGLELPPEIVSEILEFARPSRFMQFTIRMGRPFAMIR